MSGFFKHYVCSTEKVQMNDNANSSCLYHKLSFVISGGNCLFT